MNKVTSTRQSKKLFCGNSQSLIIVADCAKAEHLVRFFDCISGEYLYKNPFRVKNDLTGFNFLQEKMKTVLRKMKVQAKDVDFILEDPASYSNDFIYFLQKAGLNVLYVNALEASKYRENSRASNDNLDLDGIVRAALMGKTYKTNEMSSIYTRLKESHRERTRLVKEENRHKSIIHNQINQFFPGYLMKAKSGICPFTKGCIELMLCKNFCPQIFLKSDSKIVLKIIKKAGLTQPEKIQKTLADLASKCLNLAKLEPEVINRRRLRLQKQLQLFKIRRECIQYEEKVMAELMQDTPYVLLTSITGAGIVTVSAIAGELGDPIKWLDPDKTASYAGVIPRQKQSGGSQKAPIVGRAPKAANRYLKNAILTIVRISKENQHPAYRDTGITHPLKEHFDRTLLRGGSSFTSTAKKLVRIMTAMLKSETIYMPKIEETSEEAYAQWLEIGSVRMLEKWKNAGIRPTEQNYLGKWIKNKEALADLINT